jgi:exonuclease SbcC
MRLESVKMRGWIPFPDEIGIDFATLGAARVIAIVGPNGAGKSTFVNLAIPGAMFYELPDRDGSKLGNLKDFATDRAAYVEARLVNGKAYTIRHTVDAVSGGGSCSVQDADGKPLLDKGGIKEFKAWAAKHLEPPSVVYASTFAAQRAGGFLAATEGDRKAILLRVLGVERYERLAKTASTRAGAARAEIVTADARLADERGRSGDPAELEQQHAAALDEVKAADLRVALARADLAEAQEGARAREAGQKRKAELEQAIAAARTKVADLGQRVGNNRAVLADAEQIRDAVAQLEPSAAAIADADAAAHVAQDALRAPREEAAAARAAADAAQAEARGARTQVERARERIGAAEEVERAAAALPELRIAAEDAGAAEADERGAIEELRGQRLAGADDRIGLLRGGLVEIAGLLADAPPTAERAAEIANRTLAIDEDAKDLADELPGQLKAAEAALAAASARLAAAQRAIAHAERLAARAGEIATAKADLDEALKLESAALARMRLHAATLERANERITAGTAESAGLEATWAGLVAAHSELKQLAAKAAPLASAEGRLAELEPQLATARAELGQHEQALAQLPPWPNPQVGLVEAAVERAEQQARELAKLPALLEAQIEAARVGSAALAEIEREKARLEAELADWNRLAADLGRDGLQAAEIDAAGPELTELVNDLLRECHGARWSVRIDTQRAKADGALTEDCAVTVRDSETGREAEARKFSGGQCVILGEAVSLALSMLACRLSGAERPTLVRDESGAALDPENARAYVSMLRRAAKIVGADRVLMITHSMEAAAMCDATIEIRDGKLAVTAA